jgi:hypothetical protein
MKTAHFALTALLGLTLLGGSAVAQVVGPPTPPAEPEHPFSASLLVLNSSVSIGPVAGQDLAVTTLVVTNFDSSVQQFFIFAPIFSSGSAKCGDTPSSTTSPHMQVYLAPSQTLVIPFPTPLVFNRRKLNCIAAVVPTILHGGSVEMDVIGYTQASKAK